MGALGSSRGPEAGEMVSRECCEEQAARACLVADHCHRDVGRGILLQLGQPLRHVLKGRLVATAGHTRVREDGWGERRADAAAGQRRARSRHACVHMHA